MVAIILCTIVMMIHHDLMLMTHGPETGARNRRQKLAPETGVGFWRQFFTPVAKFLAPETNTDE